MRPLAAVPIASIVAAEGIVEPPGRRRCSAMGRRGAAAWGIDLLTPMGGNVVRPLTAVPIAAFVAAEGIGEPTG